MRGYYSDKLSAERLRRCYDIAPPRVKQYLDAEIQHVMDKIQSTDFVLELGCGYGRVLEKLCQKAKTTLGIDTSKASLEYAKKILPGSNCHLLQMNAIALGFKDRSFDIVVCIQNGISSFKVDNRDLFRESIRVTKPNGIVLFSSYSDKFWEYRLEWFEIQAREGLIGEINLKATNDGVIICKDGFKAFTVSPNEFVMLTSKLGVASKIYEIDNSSVFCEIPVK